MKHYLLILLVAVALLLTSCSTNSKPSSRELKKILLKAELDRWENFKAEGIANMSYLGLTLRKNFVLSKTADELRFDVIDGGIFGSAAKPLISVYLGEYLSINSDFQPQLAIMAASMMDKEFHMGQLHTLLALAESYADEIIDEAKIEKESLQILFSPQMQLQSVKETKNNLSAAFSYTKKGEPDSILIKIKGASVELLFDNIKYGQAQVKALEKNSGGKSILNQFIESREFYNEDEIAPPEEE